MFRKCMDFMIRFSCLAFLLGWLGYTTTLAAAPQLNLGNVPLFLSSNIPPNVFFLFDDSMSMDAEVITAAVNSGSIYVSPRRSGPPGPSDPPLQSTEQAHHRDDDNDGTIDCSFGGSSYSYIVEFEQNALSDDGFDCNTADEQEWRMRNYNFNPLYFNPSKIYRPWQGVNVNNQPFQDMDITNALANPYDPNSETINLLVHTSDRDDTTGVRQIADRNGDGLPDGFRFYTWTDEDSNGLFDNGEETEYLINQVTDDDANRFGHSNAAALRQNFANWFSYHRSRDLAAKAIYGELIAQAQTANMGLATLSPAGAKVPLKLMNSDPTTGNKRDLLKALYAIRPTNPETPLRHALHDVGHYYACETNNFFSGFPCPVIVSQGGACQQNSAILMTDGFYNDAAVPGHDSTFNTDGGGSDSDFDGGLYADNLASTLADFAMDIYERDLYPSIPNQVPTSPRDQAEHQHVVTHVLTFGVGLGNIPLSVNPGAPSWPGWPASIVTNQDRLDDLRHTAYNGRGLYLPAEDPDTLADALGTALESAAAATSASAAVTLSTGALNIATRIYQARFNSEDWSGRLLSFRPEDLGNPEWDAAERLDALVEAGGFDTARQVITYNPVTQEGVPFRWGTGALSQTQAAALSEAIDPLNPTPTEDTLGQERLAYLRGKSQPTSSGVGPFRQRTHVLGDIINSEPFFVGPPAFPDEIDLPTSPGTYAAFRTAQQGRTAMVIVGGNDGFLHIFNATPASPEAGRELLAYLPNAVLGQVKELTSPTYTHRYYVDGSPTAGDVFMDTTGSWETIVVGGLRAGGKGYFALKITNPTQVNESNADEIVLWEFTDSDDASGDLGFTFSQPSLVRLRDSSAPSGHRWAAVFGNGYNSLNSSAALYIVFIEGGLDNVWTAGTDYIKLVVPTSVPTAPNGMATPAPIDLNGDFTADYIVAGDLQGNLWVFDVTSDAPSSWSSSYGTGTPLPLFTATNDSGVRQPITARPEVGLHPTEDSANPQSFLIYFGTGQYLDIGDNSTVGTQTFYAIWDTNGTAGDNGSTPPTYTRGSGGTLVRRQILSEATVQGQAVRVTDSDESIPINWDTQRGWYLDLCLQPCAAPTGERQVTDAVLRNDRIIFTTLIPNNAQCSFGGTSWLMELDATTGGRLEFAAFDLNQDEVFNDADKAPGALPADPALVSPSGLKSTVGILPAPTILAAGNVEKKYASGSETSSIMEVSEHPGVGAVGRQSWQQIVQ